MPTSQDDIDNGIKSVLKEPERNFQINPLNQTEILGIIQYLMNEVNDEETPEDLAQYYLSVIEFLKTKILYN